LSQYLVLVAIAAPYIYERYIAFSGILANRPGKLEPYNGFKSHEIKFVDQLKNCEDVILEEELGIAFLSCDPGRDRWNTVMVPSIPTSLHPIPHKNLTVFRELSHPLTPPNPNSTTAPSTSTPMPTPPTPSHH
jgi:hypothetical protein